MSVAETRMRSRMNDVIKEHRNEGQINKRQRSVALIVNKIRENKWSWFEHVTRK